MSDDALKTPTPLPQRRWSAGRSIAEVTNAMYLRPPGEDTTAFLRSLSLYYSDIVLLEPALVKLYDELLPELDRALGG